KGATPEMVEFLDAALARYDRILQRDAGQDVGRVPGAGAAGGLGAGLMALLGGRLVSGIELVLSALDFETKAAGASLVLTGEGKFDAQSAYGKVPMGVARRSRALGVPVVVIAGTVLPSAEILHGEGVSAYFSIINRPMSLKEAMEGAVELLENQVAEVIRLYSISNGE
ncbi:glycerate kinase, partial [Candidatus Darwinibacter acetoxidans]